MNFCSPSCLCCQYTCRWWREKGGKEGRVPARDLVGASESFPDMQHVQVFFQLFVISRACLLAKLWGAGGGCCLFVILLCLVFAIHFCYYSPCSEGFKDPLLELSCVAGGAGLVSVLRSVLCVHWEFCGMLFTLGFTLITLTSLSKETKRTNPRNRISIKMAFPEEGLSFLRQPRTMWRNASRICSRQLRIQNGFLFLFFLKKLLK